MPCVQTRIHADFDSAESIVDSDLEDGELRKMLDAPLCVHGRGENYGSSHTPTASGKPEAKIIHKRGASAQRTQADHSRRESLRSNSSQEPPASGTPDAVFSSRSEEPGNQLESSFLKSKLGRSLLKGFKDHLLCQARSQIMKQAFPTWNKCSHEKTDCREPVCATRRIISCSVEVHWSYQTHSDLFWTYNKSTKSVSRSLHEFFGWTTIAVALKEAWTARHWEARTTESLIPVFPSSVSTVDRMYAAQTLASAQ